MTLWLSSGTFNGYFMLETHLGDESDRLTGTVTYLVGG